MKEQLIPRLVQAGLKVRAVPLRGRVIPIRNEECYINAMVSLLEDVDNRDGFTSHLPAKHPTIWIDPTAYVHPQARVVGPAYVGPGAKIMGDAVVIGPAIVSADCEVEGDAIVHESILWRGARVGAGAMVEQTVMAADAVVPAAAEVRGSIVIETSLSTAERQSISRSLDLDPIAAEISPVRRLWRRFAGALRTSTSRHASVARA
jgi:NDP-sugar pyrophosphorylase family protein